MGTAFVLPIWLIIIFVLVPVLIYGIKKKKRWQIIISGAVIAFHLLLFCHFYYRAYMSNSPQWTFKQAFGVSPDSKIKILNHLYQFGTDYEVICLKFEIDKENLSKLMQDKFKSVNKEEFTGSIQSCSIPEWFEISNADTGKFYILEPIGKNGYHAQAFFNYNEKNNTALFYRYWVE